MDLKIERCPENPIVWPGKWDWRMSNTYNPGALYENGRFYLYERTAGSLRPHHCYIGMLESQDGIHFRHVSDKPVLSPEMVGYPYGSVQDPRVVKIEDTYYMTFAFRRFAWNISPTGLGAPEASQAQFPGFDPSTDRNQTRSGIAVSRDRLHWEFFGWVTPEQIDDRDVILFPEKINGRFATSANRLCRHGYRSQQRASLHPHFLFNQPENLERAGSGHPPAIQVGGQPHWRVHAPPPDGARLVGAVSRR
jgi:predicted GH43/DUF377 family glycosyl hydrolase